MDEDHDAAMDVDPDASGAVDNAAEAVAPNGMNGAHPVFDNGYTDLHDAPAGLFERKLWEERLTCLCATYELSTALAPDMIQTVWQECSRGISKEHLLRLNNITVKGMRFGDLLKYRKFDACKAAGCRRAINWLSLPLPLVRCGAAIWGSSSHIVQFG